MRSPLPFARGAVALALSGAALSFAHGNTATPGTIPAEPASHGPAGTSADSADATPMRLGAAGNFAQGFSQPTLAGARRLGVAALRDGMYWNRIEREPGKYVFDRPTTTYPERVAGPGTDLVVTLLARNPLYDNGDTAHSPAAVAAFGRFAAALVRHYPQIGAIEVGNEFNGPDFVSGPVRDAGIGARGAYHVALVRAVKEHVHAVRPEVRILGGATHSIPAGYLWPMLESGGAGLMDALVLHPYTTPIDQLPAQIGVLRRNPLARTLPLAITEFGSNDPARAADDMVRGYATLSSLGAESLYWYPLNERGDGMIPLLRRDGSITPAGEAYAFIAAHLAPHRARAISPDSFTFVHAFGSRTLVLWGEPRGIGINRPDIRALDALGRPLPLAELALHPEQVVVLIGDGPIELGRDVALGCQALVADTFYQFGYGGMAQSADPEPPRLQPLLTVDGSEHAWSMMAGQQTAGVPWTPYLGFRQRGGVRLTAETGLLSARSGEALTLVHRFASDRGGTFLLEARIDPVGDAHPPISVRLQDAAGREVELVESTATASDAQAGDGFAVSSPIALERDSTLTVSISSRGTGEQLHADYRIRLSDTAVCEGGRRAGRM